MDANFLPEYFKILLLFLLQLDNSVLFWFFFFLSFFRSLRLHWSDRLFPDCLSLLFVWFPGGSKWSSTPGATASHPWNILLSQMLKHKHAWLTSCNFLLFLLLLHHTFFLNKATKMWPLGDMHFWLAFLNDIVMSMIYGNTGIYKNLYKPTW